MLRRLIQTLLPQATLPTPSPGLSPSTHSSRSSHSSGCEADSLLALHQRLQVQIAQIRAWNPTDGHLCDLMSSGLDAEKRIRTLHNVNESWLIYIDSLEAQSGFYAELWQQLPGLRLQRLEAFDWTLTEPLEGRFDQMVQHHLARAAIHFAEARHAFQKGRDDHAQLHDRKGVQYCDDAEALIRCCRHGDQPHKDAVVAAFDARRSAVGRKALQDLIEQSPWDRPCEPIAPSWLEAAATRGVGVPAIQRPAPSEFGEHIQERLRRLEVILYPSPVPSATTGPLLALLQADGSVQTQFGVQGARPASPGLLDPGGRLQARLDLLMRERPGMRQSAPPSYLALLDSLEAAVEEAQAAHQKYQEAQLAITSLEQGMASHSTPVHALRPWLKEAQHLLELASKAGTAGHSSIKAQRAAHAYDLATMTRQKLEHIGKGLWPNAERQLEHGLKLMVTAKTMMKHCVQTLQTRLLHRFWALHWNYLTASTSMQAESILIRMEATLRDVQAADSEHERRRAARESGRISRPGPAPSAAAPAPFQPAPAGSSAHGCGPAEARPAP